MIVFFTIVLDGLPWIATHHATFTQLTIPWRWIIVEGVADNVADTRWCNKLIPRISTDGTTEYLDSLSCDSRVTVLRQKLWPGKVSMCNAALAQIKQPCLLWEIDADELWTVGQIHAVHELMAKNPLYNCAFFWCRFFCGPDIVITNRHCYGNNPAYEWKRVWRFKPGMQFSTHEPPILGGMRENPMPHAMTEAAGCVFDHHGYSTLKQIEFKQTYYSSPRNPHAREYCRAIDGWKRLQANTQWPTGLRQFFPWVDNAAIVDRVRH